jgi:hypothetical protein
MPRIDFGFWIADFGLKVPVTVMCFNPKWSNAIALITEPASKTFAARSAGVLALGVGAHGHPESFKSLRLTRVG